MKDEPISRKVLWDSIQSWIEECKYYDGETPKKIPLAEVKALIQGCPCMGDDWSWLKTERLEKAKNAGANQIIKAVLGTIEQFDRNNAQLDKQ